MTSCISDTVILIPCDKCAAKTRKSLLWIKKNKTLSCKCGHTTSLKTEAFEHEIAQCLLARL